MEKVGRVLGARLAAALVLALAPGGPALAGDAETEAEVATQAKKADELFQAQSWQASADEYGTAITLLEDVEQDERARAGTTISEIPAQYSEIEEAVKAAREALVRLDSIEKRLAPLELGVARCRAQLGDAEGACRAVARALGRDLSLLDAIGKDKHLVAARNHPDYPELLFRIQKGRLDLGEPAANEYFDRSFRWALRLAPGDPDIARPPTTITALYTLARRITDTGDGLPLTPQRYEGYCRLALLVPERHRGWPYLHASLFDGGRLLEEIDARARKRRDERRGKPDGPFYAYMATFPLLHLGRYKEARATLEEYRERSPLLGWAALEGFQYLATASSKDGSAMPGLSKEETKALAEPLRADVLALQPTAVRLQAWMGNPMYMTLIGRFHLEGAPGIPKDATRAVKWFQGGHQLDFRFATLNLADCLMEGKGIEKDTARAIELVTPSVEAGDPDALNMIGYYHQYGKGVERDYGKARDYLRQAAQRGQTTAMESLGLLMQRGLGGDAEPDAAEGWFRKALAAGYVRAERRLGQLALEERTSDADLPKASEHFAKYLAHAPDDRIGLLYLWTALVLQGKAKEAQEAAKTFLGRMTKQGIERDEVAALTKAKFEPAPVLRRAATEKDEDLRREMTGQAHFLAAVQALAAKDRAKAKDLLRACVDQGLEVDSTRYTAMAELKRLE